MKIAGCILLMLIASWRHVKTTPTEARDFVLDEMGNFYLIFNSHLERQNVTGTGQFRTSDLVYGNIECLDVTNSLKPFIYYKSIGKIVNLDNTLSEQGSGIDLFEKGFEQVEFVAGSKGDAYWLWDSRNSELIRVDQNFQRLTSTGNLGVLLGRSIKPLQIVERGNYVFIRTEDQSVVILDIYGNYKTTLKISTKQDIQIQNEEIIFAEGNQLHKISLEGYQENVIELPELPTGRVWVKGSHLYLKNGSGIVEYEYVESAKN